MVLGLPRAGRVMVEGVSSGGYRVPVDSFVSSACGSHVFRGGCNGEGTFGVLQV